MAFALLSTPAPGAAEDQAGREPAEPSEAQEAAATVRRAAPCGVLVALPGGILPGENAEVRRAVDVYLHDFRPEVEEIGPLPGGMPAQTARTVEVARSRSLRLAVVLFWSAEPTSRELTATFIDLWRPSARPIVFTIGWPHQPDSAFYRNLGLKLRSTLLSMVGAPPEEKKRPGGGAGTPWGGDLSRPRFGLEGWVMGGLAIETRAPVPAFGGSLRMELGRWSLGAGASRTLEERRTHAAVEGDTALTRVGGIVGFRLGPTWSRFGVVAEVQGAALHIRTTGRVFATGAAHDYGQWIPVFSLGFLAVWDIGSHVRVGLGPRLDVFGIRGWLTLEGTRVYDTGWVQPWLDLRIAFFF